MSTLQPFGRWLREQRKAHDLTQAALAQQVGCSVIALQKIEAGARRPSLQMAERIAAALGLDPAIRPQFLAAARGLSEPASAASAEGLPIPLTPLLGREHDVNEIQRLLASKSTRLFTLWGPAGVGKTRLALEVARLVQQQAAFADGVAFVDLAPVARAELVTDAIAHALSLQLDGGMAPEAALASQLRSRHMLLVLDNMEQVLEAGPAIARLLARCRHLTAIVTSRALLRVRGEHPYLVEPLALPRSDAPADLFFSPAVALFLARAGETALEAAHANPAVVAAICRKLDGLPLAIELVAARARLLSPEQILARLDAVPFQLLARGPADLPKRQQALEAAIGWSYELLAPHEQALFARTGVFVGGCDTEAIEAICGRPGMAMLDEIAALLDNSLLRQTAATPAPRFAMLEMVRAYALARLAERGEEGRIRQAHADYYTALAEAAEPELNGGEQVPWLERLAREHDNLRAALEWSLSRAPQRGGVRLAAALWRFWWLRGHLAEGRRWLSQAILVLNGTPAMHDNALLARLLSGAGVLADKHGDYAEAMRAFEASLELRRALGDRAGVAATLNSMGVVARALGQRAEARLLFSESLAIRRELAPDRIGPLLSNLATVLIEDGAYGQAQTLAGESLSLCRSQGNTLGIACALNILGIVATRQEDPARAAAYLQQGLDLFVELGDHDGIAESLEGLAEVALHQHDPVQVARLAGAAAALRLAIGAQAAPEDRAAHAACIAAARSQTTPAAWRAAWAEGHNLTLPEIVAAAHTPPHGSQVLALPFAAAHHNRSGP